MQRENAALSEARHGLEQARAEFEAASCAGCREDERDRGAPGAGALGAASESAGAGTIAAATDV
ncbi:hypothetical protein [Pantoea stewartii]|uniref:hypothetical protein n=1 Tax=Pantoea stewartii TaxID=66269 RepID=UPI003DA746A8